MESFSSLSSSSWSPYLSRILFCLAYRDIHVLIQVHKAQGLTLWSTFCPLFACSWGGGVGWDCLDFCALIVSISYSALSKEEAHQPFVTPPHLVANFWWSHLALPSASASVVPCRFIWHKAQTCNWGWQDYTFSALLRCAGVACLPINKWHPEYLSRTH